MPISCYTQLFQFLVFCFGGWVGGGRQGFIAPGRYTPSYATGLQPPAVQTIPGSSGQKQCSSNGS